ncbi:MAG: diguanylate cyclase [Deltaproteobacteria bacterium]|nr:diguanylate cyclase [Deltaproteobacteria bacterium]
MKAADLSRTASKPQRFRSLRSKVFFPFILLVVALFTIAILGSIHLADHSFKSSADERLAATQEVLFREFKKQEVILQTYAIIMQQFQSLSERFQNEAEIGILQDSIFNTLEEANISTAFFPADIRGLIQQESLVSLFDQVRRSNRPRFRYSNEFGGTPVLLQTDMGEAFLRKVISSLKISATIMTIDGQIRAKSNADSTDLKLSPAQINLIGTGQPLYLDHEGTKGPERHLFSIIPLGRSDMILLSLEASLTDSEEIQKTTILQMVLVMIAVIIFGTLFYFRRIRNIIRPAVDLRNAAEAISRGNLNYRIREISNDELGQIATAFNQMTAELESSYQERANLDIAAALANEDDKTQLMLERKERERDKISEELNIIQRETSALYQLNQAMTASIELSSIFDRILQVLNEILSCDHIVLLVHNPGESILEVVRTSGLDINLLSKVQFTFNQGITGEVAQSQRMIYVKNIDEDKRNLSYHGQVVTRGSMVSVPLVFKGRLVGVLNLHNRQVAAFSASEQKLIQAIANQTAVAIYNAQMTEKSRELNNIDELTGLSNRRHFQEILKREVAQARRFSSIFSIVMCDIDGFKQHKNTLGHIHSDALLRQIGQSLLKSTRGIDLVSRFGKDQFIILLPKTNKSGAVAAAEKLRKNFIDEDLSQQINYERSIKVTLSFGVTEFPGDSKNIYELLNLADRALYAAKQDGSNCTVAWEGPAPEPE